MPGRKIIFLSFLSIVSAFFVISTYGILSDFTGVSFFVISASLLALIAVILKHGMDSTETRLLSSEDRHFFNGNTFRSFSDSAGEIWLRESDISRNLGLKYPAKTLRNSHKEYFKKVNPLLEVWYMHPKILRNAVGANLSEREQILLSWIEQSIIGVHCGLSRLNGRPIIPELPASTKHKNKLIQLWRGELGLFSSLFFGGITVYLFALFFSLIKISDITAHYKILGLIYIASVVFNFFTIFWWSHGIALASQRWLSQERSIFLAVFSILLSIYLAICSISILFERESQYGIAEWISIVSDHDIKPSVIYNSTLNAIVISGNLGFGASNLLREEIESHSEVKIIGLISYGGRVEEGLSINKIIKERKLSTYSWAECMSSCVIAYIGGQNRYISRTAKFGLHRSGFHWDKVDTGPNYHDLHFAKLMRDAGVREDFIIRAQKPDIHHIYLPTTPELLSSGMATDLL